MRDFLKLLAIFTTFLIIGCSGNGESADSIDQCSALGLKSVTTVSPSVTAKIANGIECTNLNKSPVVMIVKNNPDGSAGICSGTMITPTKVLTAAHCLENAASIDVLLGISATKLAYITTNVWRIDPNFNRSATGILGNDVGVITVSQPLPLPTVPILVSSAPEVAQKAVIFGYGTTGAAEDYGQLRSGVMRINDVDTARIFAKYESYSSDVCPGDSGGPLLLQIGNQQTLAGTTSYGDSISCTVGEQSVFMNLQSPSIQSFLRSVAPEAAYY